MSAPNPLCRDDQEPLKFCRFATVCHDERQRLQNTHLLRGTDCWAYQLLTINTAYNPAPEAPATS